MVGPREVAAPPGVQPLKESLLMIRIVKRRCVVYAAQEFVERSIEARDGIVHIADIGEIGQ